MRTALAVLLILAATLFFGCTSSKTADNFAGNQKEMAMNRNVKLQLDYLLYLPKDYSPDKAWPLVIFLHGIGERGNNLDRLKLHGLPKLVAGGQDFEFIIASPQCPEDKFWPMLGNRVTALIDEIAEKYNIDNNRVYLTGLSMGGYGVWTIASADPERFAAIAPICGGGYTRLAGSLKDVPVWAFHGAKDNVVPLSESQSMVDAVNQAGGSAKLTVYPDAGHDSWTQTYENPELYKWLLSHKKNRDDK